MTTSAPLTTPLVLATVAVLPAGACARPSPTAQATPTACPGVRAVIIHNDTQDAVELMSYQGTSVLRSLATVRPASQSDAIPLATPGMRARELRSAATGRRVSGEGIRYEPVCLPGT